ncbi:MAG: 6-phosphogluconolactonase [Acidobacteria bacterium]|nr:MAG: 6-phosphogluconolactonase [Acidobacteriota bacterium]
MPTERFHLAGAEILVGADVEETVRIAAGQFAALTRKIAAEGRAVNVALSGGNTPRPLFQALAADPFAGLIPWDSLQFFWGDERNVPPGSPDSNYSMARELLLSKVPVPQANIHRIPTGNGTAIEAADLYERTLRELVPRSGGLPRFDYNLLGLGLNGHTASLFPGRPSLHEQQRLVVADHVDQVNSWRVTLTPPVLNNAAQITFFVLGEEKADAVKKVLEGSRDHERIPAQLIAPRDGTLTWILDSAAASQLTRA